VLLLFTYNEEKNLGRCLASVTEIADDILIVDSNSTDNTLNIAAHHRTRVIQNDFIGYGEQKNFASKQQYVTVFRGCYSFKYVLLWSLFRLQLRWWTGLQDPSNKFLLAYDMIDHNLSLPGARRAILRAVVRQSWSLAQVTMRHRVLCLVAHQARHGVEQAASRVPPSSAPASLSLLLRGIGPRRARSLGSVCVMCSLDESVLCSSMIQLLRPSPARAPGGQRGQGALTPAGEASDANEHQ
jgi:hypothetical protein